MHAKLVIGPMRTLFISAVSSSVAFGVPADSSQFGFLRANSDPAVRSSDSLRTNIEEQGAQPESESPGFVDREAWYDLPPWLYFSISDNSLYDDNIYLVSENTEGSWIHLLAPAFIASSGEEGTSIWQTTTSYTPVYALYSSATRPSSFDQAMAAEINFNGNRLRASAQLSYAEATANDRYVRDILTTTTTSSAILLNYDLSGKTSLISRLYWRKTGRGLGSAGQVYSDEENIGLEVSVLWQASGKTRLGPSLRLAATDSSLNSDRNSVAFLLRVDQDSSAKLSFSGGAGADYTSYDEGNGSKWGPSVDLAGNYAMNALSGLRLNVYSRNSPSPSGASSDMEATGLTASLSLNLNPGLRCSVGAGLEKARYEYLLGLAGRPDTYSFGEVRISAGRPEKRLSMDLFYRHRLVNSTIDSQDFLNNQIGLQLALQF